MEFLHISDLHYKKRYPIVKNGYASIFNKMTSPIDMLISGFKQIKCENLSFVLISGDLTENGMEEDYKELKNKLDVLFYGIPYIVTLGNHDNKEMFYKIWEPEINSIYPYGSITNIDGINIIALDNSVEGNPHGLITEEHCKWLVRAFEYTKGTKRILMMHHPLIFDKVTPVPVVKYPDEFPQIIKKYLPSMILCGHTHNELYGSFEGVLYATAGSMSFKGGQKGNGEICFREHASANLCKMEGNLISIEEITFTEYKKVLANMQL